MARLPTGRYRVQVELEETMGEMISTGKYRTVPKTVSHSFKRENLQAVDVSIGTNFRNNPGVAAALRDVGGPVIETTAEREAREPGVKGWFPAVMQGDDATVSKILSYIQQTYQTQHAADQIMDATGDTSLMGGIQNGHVEVVKLLIQYGADVNRVCNMPMMKPLNLSYLGMAIMLVDTAMSTTGGKQVKPAERESIVNMLLDSGADISVTSQKGTPLFLACNIACSQQIRLRLSRKILDLGADPNQTFKDPMGCDTA